VVKGLNRYEGKDKRRQRMRNHIAKDLRENKFRQRVVPDRKKKFLLEENEGYYFQDEYETEDE
jgi:hypothetical protein